MDFSYVIFTLILIGVGLIDYNEKRKLEDSYKDKIEKIHEEHSRNWSSQYESYCEEKENLKIKIVAATFDCSIESAKVRYYLLRKNYLDTDFIFAESNKERIEIYNKLIHK
jgi:hypothetical protein